MAIFCDVKQAADLFRVSVSMFYKLVRQGVIPPPCKIGTRSLWLYSDIERAAHKIPQSKTWSVHASNEDNHLLPTPTDSSVDPLNALKSPENGQIDRNLDSGKGVV
jgi:predicted DNA-binding transcriptional regulator AlpA